MNCIPLDAHAPNKDKLIKLKNKFNQDNKWIQINMTRVLNIHRMRVCVTMYNVRNIRISDGCVYAQIRKGLGMHLVTYTNRDTVPFLLLVQYKGGLSEIELIVSSFSIACMILLLFLKI